MLLSDKAVALHRFNVIQHIYKTH